MGTNRDGRPSGLAVIMFYNETDAANAVDGLRREFIDGRYMILKQIPFSDYVKFAKFDPSVMGHKYSIETIKLSDHVNEDNRDRALALKWLPHDITKEEIIKIFNNDYGEITLNQVVVQKTKGRQIGNALVILESYEYA